MLEAVLAHEVGHHRHLHPLAIILGWWCCCRSRPATGCCGRSPDDQVAGPDLRPARRPQRRPGRRRAPDGALGMLVLLLVLGVLVVAGGVLVVALGLLWLPLSLLVRLAKVLSAALSRAGEHAADRHAAELGYGLAWSRCCSCPAGRVRPPPAPRHGRPAPPPSLLPGPHRRHPRSGSRPDRTIVVASSSVSDISLDRCTTQEVTQHATTLHARKRAPRGVAGRPRRLRAVRSPPPPMPPGPPGAWGFGGRGRGRGRRGRGDVRAAILALLAQRPMHGYEMIQELEARTGGVWRRARGRLPDPPAARGRGPDQPVRRARAAAGSPSPTPAGRGRAPGPAGAVGEGRGRRGTVGLEPPRRHGPDRPGHLECGRRRHRGPAGQGPGDPQRLAPAPLRYPRRDRPGGRRDPYRPRAVGGAPPQQADLGHSGLRSWDPRMRLRRTLAREIRPRRASSSGGTPRGRRTTPDDPVPAGRCRMGSVRRARAVAGLPRWPR